MNNQKYLIEDLQHFQDKLGIKYTFEELNEDVLVKILESHYEKIDVLDSKNFMENYNNFCYADALLKTFLKLKFSEFEITDEIYKWEKEICDAKIRLLNQWRAFGFYISFEEYLSQNNRRKF